MAQSRKPAPDPKSRRNWATIIAGLVVALLMAAVLIMSVVNNIKRNNSMGTPNSGPSVTALAQPTGRNLVPLP